MESLIFSDQIGNNGKVFAIEPHPKTYLFLRMAVTENERNNVYISNVAISDKKV